MADLAFGTAGEERLRECGEKLLASGRWGQQVAADAMQQLPAEGEFLFSETIGQETEEADALKAGRQGVEEKAADELVGGEGVLDCCCVSGSR